MPVHNGPGARVTSRIIGTGYFCREKSGRGFVLNMQTLLVPSWRVIMRPYLSMGRDLSKALHIMSPLEIPARRLYDNIKMI